MRCASLESDNFYFLKYSYQSLPIKNIPMVIIIDIKQIK